MSVSIKVIEVILLKGRNSIVSYMLDVEVGKPITIVRRRRDTSYHVAYTHSISNGKG
jgi:hypothetical protein